MKPIADMSIGELAAFINSHLKRNNIDVVLSGGSCISIYTQNKYSSLDLDFIEIWSNSRQKLKKILGQIGFIEKNRYFESSETNIFLEFPTGPPFVGKEPVKEINILKFSTGELRIISPTDSVKDRLAAYFHWKDKQALDQAVLVARDNEIDLDEVERWSAQEGYLTDFQEIKILLKKLRPLSQKP